ncbi:MAG TPA: 4-(cytidine 5'-diphospho)-2-C-methyl-D-erythritol kinase [Candidatus Lachnoclostridium stercorigallinarum]|uniref:4-diphosphocytidyl-2-C-methyl-D-erythritol kinase n=1 Tax=Candidatus Lachnoclostridium stercorigallinarum TaxID=2838634 RepID=A0A9D2K6P1_9FIRM|nr:4-(cytidine 5'-diphospho)-2-C-methyl-D-erythritol kinase [Candidatus Lachnoclostridium stercorigallinarum]
MIKRMKLKAYGKINLGLDVLRKREDGYHEVKMVMQTVGLYDIIDLRATEQKGIRVETNLYYLPSDRNNLVWKAAEMLMSEFDLPGGLDISLKKMIPVAAGMAGGSSDAAAVLYGVNRMFHLGLSLEELKVRGVKIGADVPYCLMRGTALSEGIGEILTPLPPVPQCWVLLAKPKISVSTKWVYSSLHANELRPEDHPDIDGLVDAIRRGDLRGMAGKFGNVLELVTEKRYPIIEEIKDEMKRHGALNAMMSGSGPTVFGLFEDARAAKKAYWTLKKGRLSGGIRQVYLTNFFNNREVSNGL